MSGQLCRVAEGLSFKDITLAHSHPPPSPQKSDGANRVQKFGRAAPFLQDDKQIGVSYKSVPSGNLAWSRPVQITHQQNHVLAFSEILKFPLPEDHRNQHLLDIRQSPPPLETRRGMRLDLQHQWKILFRIGELNLLLPDSGCPLQAGTGHGRPSRTPGRCGCAVTSLLQRCCRGAVC